MTDPLGLQRCERCQNAFSLDLDPEATAAHQGVAVAEIDEAGPFICRQCAGEQLSRDERYPAVRFRLGDLLPEIDARADPPEPSVRARVAQRDLGRYYHLLQETLATVDLSRGEAGLLVDVCNGWATHVEPPELLAHGLALQVDDGCRLEALDEKWHVERVPLVEKIEAWSTAQAIAVIDAIERFWIDPNPLDVVLVRVGLIATVAPGGTNIKKAD